MEISQWESEIQEEREQKDLFFRKHSQLLIPPEERFTFEGFDYYHSDQNYRFKIELHEHGTKWKIKVQDTNCAS